MKDSGIEWLGSTPVHWDAGVIRRAAKLESGHTPSRQHPEYWEDCSIPWFTLADIWQVRPGIREYVSETSECVSEVGIAHSSARLLPAGTVLLSRTASVGFSAIAKVPLATSQDFANWVCGDALLPAYLLYVFRSMRGELMRLTMGSTHKTIYMPIIAKLAGPLPSTEEQGRIVEHIRRETRALDALSLRIGRAIERLSEYRSALITAAVTGQIDVRTYRRDPEEVLEAN
jgi:type I restriction enzyme S subunit